MSYVSAVSARAGACDDRVERRHTVRVQGDAGRRGEVLHYDQESVRAHRAHTDVALFGQQDVRTVLGRLHERAARGLSTLFVDPLVQAYASAWAAHLSATNTFVHQNLLNLLHAANGRFIEAGENLFRASGAPAMNAGTAHVALMESPEHRANILLPEERYVGVGAVCAHGFLVVVEGFATPASIALHAHGVPPLNPIVAGAGAGAHC